MDSMVDRAALARVVAVINGKGGVGKTTLTANLAGMLAASGYRVLVADLDAQGNLGIDLGYRHSDADDDGRALAAALAFGSPVAPLRNVRAGLDALIGGGALRVASAALETGSVAGEPRAALARTLAPLAGGYDLVLLDCPPGGEAMQNAACAAARWLLVPSSIDAGGASGLALVAERLRQVADINPGADLLGVAVFNVAAQASKVIANTRAALAAVAGRDDVVFDAVVRHSPSFAQQSRKYGKLAHELEGIAAAQPKWWQTVGASPEVEMLNGERVSDTSGKVAADLQALANEVLARITAAEAREVAA